jgi:hypothetical protein
VPPRTASAAAGPATPATGLVLARLMFARPIFGGEDGAWTFVCDAAMAEGLQQAMLERRPYKLVFPTNTVVVDTAAIVLADFQPQG